MQDIDRQKQTNKQTKEIPPKPHLLLFLIGIQVHYNLMGVRSCMLSVSGLNVLMQHMTVTLKIKKGYLKETEEKKKTTYKGTIILIAFFLAQQ